MTVKIPLRLRGLDLRDVDAYARIGPDLADLSWEANGGVSLAVVYSDDRLPIAAAADWARRIVKLMPGVEVVEVHDELVSISDIAARAGVAAEAARLWAVGKRRASLRLFPSPRQVVGSASHGKSMSLYAWREVVSWIRDVIGIDPDEGIEYLNDAQHAELNAELAAIASAAVWRAITVETGRVSARGDRACRSGIDIFGLFDAELLDEPSAVGHRGTLRVALR
jgi:hypothetical protein